MRVWWLADPARLARERASAEGAEAEGWFKPTRWHLAEARLTLDGVITAHGAEYAIRLVYPDQFPSVPAWVVPQDPEVRWSTHQYGKGGSLCLELRPDTWHHEATGGDVLRSAYHLLRTENPSGNGPKGEVPADERIGVLQRYTFVPLALFIHEGCLERLVEGTAVDVRAIRWAPAGDAWPIMVWDGVDAESGAHPPEPGILRGEMLDVRVVRHAPLPDVPTTRAELGAALGCDFAEYETRPLLVLAVGDGGLAAYHSPGVDSVYARSQVTLRDDAGARSGRTAADAPKRVAVVGLGSVGSKVAEALLRSGYHRLVLVDGDVMLPGNLERHTLDWRDVGALKVDAVKARLQAIEPTADVRVVRSNLNWQHSARRYAEIADALVTCDLIVDATGDAATDLFLGAIAAENQRSFLSVEVLEGGIGCIITRSVPKRDPPFVHVHGALLAYCDAQEVSLPRSGARPYEAFDAEGEPVVADDAAVSVAAAHTARIAVDILRGRLGEEPAPLLLVGLALAWVFDGHGHTIAVSVPPAASADDREESNPELLQQAVDFTRSLSPESSDEAPTSS